MRISEAEMHQMIATFDKGSQGFIHYNDFMPYIVHHEYCRLNKHDNDDQDLIDAYVSIGGEEDGSGCVDAQKLISIVKNEFAMTIDIERLIKEIDEDGSGAIEFDEFKKLLT